ncbi:MAG TPA: type II toxin-antitoxin system RelE/ParE family toxin [Terriglobales bacterium]|nr:type II toxin-antitoxin system RelE/ParE family toxin [Terriglobales bacterium]
MLVRWLEFALENLNAEAEYIARDNPAAAARTVQHIFGAIKQLEQFPAIGRPGRVPGTRELVVAGTPYIIPYRVRQRYLETLRVFHGARRGPKEF